jgi:tetratricopeptide (TPR) repeat protein
MLAPEDARAWANQGVALMNFQRLNEALENFNRALTLDEHSFFALHMKGEILCRLGRMQEAIAVTREALLQHPGHTPSLVQAAQALRALEMYDALKEVARELIAQVPDNLFAWENYMRAWRGLGQYAEANETLDQLLQLDPANVRFWTLKADTLHRLERYREAVRCSEHAVRLDMDYAPARRIYEKSLKQVQQKREKAILHTVHPQG